MEENKKSVLTTPKSKSEILCTINIVTYNALEKTKESIQKLEWVRNRKDLKVFIADNASTEPVYNFLKDLDWVEKFQIEKNVGFGGGHNFLYNNTKHLNAAFTLVLNPDCILEEKDFNQLIKTAQSQSNNGIGIVGPKIYGADGELEQSIAKELKLSNTLIAMFGQLMGIKQRFPQIPKTGQHEVEAVTGACMLINNSLISKVGFFEPRIFMYYEDSEFCLRAGKADYKIIFDADAQVKHYLNASSNTVENASDWKNEMMFKSLLVYFDLHRNWFQKRVLKYGWIIGLCLRYILGRRRDSSIRLIKYTLDYKFGR